MNSLPARLKALLRTYLPGRVRTALQKRRQVRALQSVPISEEPDLLVVRALVQPGNIVVDAGANYGLYTRFLSEQVGATGLVFSCEPIPSTHAVLSYVVRQLKLSNVQLRACALSDVNAEVLMTVPDFPEGGENPYMAHIVVSGTGGSAKAARIPAIPLDTLVAGQRSVDFIKIDVEGHEWPCIQGARHTLESYRPALLIEISQGLDQDGSPSAQLNERLCALGYDAYWFNGEVLMRRQRGDSSVNFFYLQPGHLERLRPTIPVQ